MSAARREGFSPMLLSRGDCHQFMSWHLNHPLQIWVFEMQIQLRMPRQIKRHTHTRARTQAGKYKTTFEDISFYFFYRRSLHCQTLLFLFAESAATRADNAAHGKRRKKRHINWLYIYLQLCSPGREKEERHRGAVFILPSAWLFAPLGVCSMLRVCVCFFPLLLFPQDTVR